MDVYNMAVVKERPEYLNRKLLLCNVNHDGLFQTHDGNNILIEFNCEGMISVTAISATYGLIPAHNLSLLQLGKDYLRLSDPAIENVLKHLILPEMEVERIFNSVRYRYLMAIYLSDFDNPQQYMNARYNKAFQALAGIEVTQANDVDKKDNEYFWQEAGFSRQARDLDWGKDIADLDRILGILRINNLRFNYPTLYKELIAIKPGFHELMIHGNYFDKTPVGDTLRDNVFRMLRGLDCNDDYHIRSLPQDIETIAYFRYAPCHVTEGPFVLRKSLSVSYFDEICKIDSKERLECVSNNFYMVAYNKLAIDSKVKLTTCLNETKKFTKYLTKYYYEADIYDTRKQYT